MDLQRLKDIRDTLISERKFYMRMADKDKQFWKIVTDRNHRIKQCDERIATAMFHKVVAAE